MSEPRRIYSVALVGDAGVGKTALARSLGWRELVRGGDRPALYAGSVAAEPADPGSEGGARRWHINLWDCPSTARKLGDYFLVAQLNCALIVCQLRASRSCERPSLEGWKQLLGRQRPRLPVAVVALSPKEVDQTVDRNRRSVLEWCADNGDLPYFEVQCEALRDSARRSSAEGDSPLRADSEQLADVLSKLAGHYASMLLASRCTR